MEKKNCFLQTIYNKTLVLYILMFVLHLYLYEKKKKNSVILLKHEIQFNFIIYKTTLIKKLYTRIILCFR